MKKNIFYRFDLSIKQNFILVKMEKTINKRILLVDDEPNILIPLEFLMHQQGYEVEKAYNGKDALAKMRDYVPRVVVLDVMMPGMSGFEVAKEIRKQITFAETQIVFLTAKSTPEDRLNGYANGGEVYLAKPFDNQEFIETINDLVDEF